MRTLASLLSGAALAACGGTEPNVAAVELRAAGPSPANAQVGSAGSLRFVNKDAAEHQVASTTCPELATARLAPGAEQAVRLGTGPKSCAYDDALAPASATPWGTVEVLSPGSGGGK